MLVFGVVMGVSAALMLLRLLVYISANARPTMVIGPANADQWRRSLRLGQFAQQLLYVCVCV